ncbi:MAG: hypothetical protein KJ915_08845 [Candidatus Omnitrophica bacterium]|nr:hypothetical protein [Candidatus Omnitrophota bacterium]
MKFKLIIFSFTFLTIICLLPVKASADSNKDMIILKKHCSSCHASERVFNIEKTSTGWTKTVNWMRKHSKNAFSQKKAKQITKAIIALHPNYSRKIFEIRCAQCHDLKSTKKLNLDPQQWNRLVYRERAKAITWISLDEAKDIAAYLAAAYPAKETKDTNEPIRALVEEKCLRCHIHATVFNPIKTLDQWIAVNKRMQEKSPELISDKQVLKISEYLNKINPLAGWE